MLLVLLVLVSRTEMWRWWGIDGCGGCGGGCGVGGPTCRCKTFFKTLHFFVCKINNMSKTPFKHIFISIFQNIYNSWVPATPSSGCRGGGRSVVSDHQRWGHTVVCSPPCAREGRRLSLSLSLSLHP